MGLVQPLRADPELELLNEEVAALIKGMLKRGGMRQCDIAAYFGTNQGRVCEINTGKLYPEVAPAPPEKLPPWPCPTPYDLFRMKNAVWRGRVALEAALDAVQDALAAVHKLEQR